jgi:hypothetical protein
VRVGLSGPRVNPDVMDTSTPPVDAETGSREGEGEGGTSTEGPEVQVVLPDQPQDPCDPGDLPTAPPGFKGHNIGNLATIPQLRRHQLVSLAVGLLTPGVAGPALAGGPQLIYKPGLLSEAEELRAVALGGSACEKAYHARAGTVRGRGGFRVQGSVRP